jgi:hypothetical protein
MSIQGKILWFAEMEFVHEFLLAHINRMEFEVDLQSFMLEQIVRSIKRKVTFSFSNQNRDAAS